MPTFRSLNKTMKKLENSRKKGKMQIPYSLQTSFQSYQEKR